MGGLLLGVTKLWSPKQYEVLKTLLFQNWFYYIFFDYKIPSKLKAFAANQNDTKVGTLQMRRSKCVTSQIDWINRILSLLSDMKLNEHIMMSKLQDFKRRRSSLKMFGLHHCCYQEKFIFFRYNGKLILTFSPFANPIAGA